MLTVLAFAAVLLLALSVMAFIADHLMDRSVANETPPRVEQRIPAEEMALTGTDYRDHVAPYFAKRSRHEQIITRTLRQDR